MKILSRSQIQEADKRTIENEPITSIELMERASEACVFWFEGKFGPESSVHVICGKGNNGGDGLAIARLLRAKGFNVRVSVLNFFSKSTGDFEENYNRLSELDIELCAVNRVQDLSLSENEIIVDAMLGSGTSKALSGELKQLVELVNASRSMIVSIDVPSGLFMDQLNTEDELSIYADYSVTFQSAPLSFFFKENYTRVGNWEVLDIGLDKAYLESAPSKHYYVQSEDVSILLKIRGKHAYKNNFGHALLIAGSAQQGGASILSAQAALRSGVGLLTMGIPLVLQNAHRVSNPEAMLEFLGEESIERITPLETYSCIGVGPGIGTKKNTQAALKVLIQEARQPIIFDADAINILAQNKTWLSFIPPNCIFTPHIGEFKRLVKNTSNSEVQLKAQIEFCKKYQCVMVLKGAETQIALPDGRVYFNSTGNPGMATGGSGDVLLGLITGLLARGYHAMHAAILGVFVHGLAGDECAKLLGKECMKASDIIGCIPAAFKKL